MKQTQETPGIEIPEVALTTTHYYRDSSYVQSFDDNPYLTELEREAFDLAFINSDEALQDGNLPIGAVLINNENGQMTAARTIDATKPSVIGHAETIALEM